MSDKYSDLLKENDIIIFPMFSDRLNEGVLAVAGSCLTDEEEKPRPIVGVLYLNQDLDFIANNTELFMKNLLFHELTHALVFDPDLLINLGMAKKEDSLVYITSPKVLQEVNNHFNCSIDKFPLENQGEEGNVGAHWDSRYMLGDYMCADYDYREVVMSNISIALFEDTGYYKVNYYSGGLFKYGKNKVCDFLNKKCVINGEPISEEFFYEEDRDKDKCSPSRTIRYSSFLFSYDEKLDTEYQYFSDPNLGGYQYAEFCPVAFGEIYNNDDDKEDDYFLSSGNFINQLWGKNRK